jgi:hypothetical protein
VTLREVTSSEVKPCELTLRWYQVRWHHMSDITWGDTTWGDTTWGDTKWGDSGDSCNEPLQVLIKIGLTAAQNNRRSNQNRIKLAKVFKVRKVRFAPQRSWTFDIVGFKAVSVGRCFTTSRSTTVRNVETIWRNDRASHLTRHQTNPQYLVRSAVPIFFFEIRLVFFVVKNMVKDEQTPSNSRELIKCCGIIMCVRGEGLAFLRNCPARFLEPQQRNCKISNRG